MHGHDQSILPHHKPEKAANILSQLPSNISSINQSQIAINVSIKSEVGRTGLKRKVPGAYTFLKPKVFSQSPQIQRPTLPSQK